MPDQTTKRGNQDVLQEILAVVQHIQREVKQLKKEQRKMGTELENLNARIEAQNTILTDFQAASQAATDAISKEIQQVVDLVAAATNLDQLKAGISAAADRIGSNNDALSAATATLVQNTANLAADDQPAPPTP